MNRWLALFLPMLLLCALAYLGWRLDRAERARLVERDGKIAAELKAAGLEEALSKAPTEVVKYVDRLVPQEVIKMVERKEVVPIESIRIETKEVPITIPCGPDGLLHSSVQVTGGFFLGTTPLGKPYWKRALFVHVQGIPEPIDFSEDPGIQLAFSDQITKLIAEDAKRSSRWRFSPRPVREWRTGLSLGAGLCVPLTPVERPTFCGSFTWGLQF